MCLAGDKSCQRLDSSSVESEERSMRAMERQRVAENLAFLAMTATRGQILVLEQR